MDILIIAVLILLGLLFCVVELLILPGVSVGAILSFVCLGSAIYMAFNNLGIVATIVVVVIIIALSSFTLAFSLRAKTWDRFTLKSKINSMSTDVLEAEFLVGRRGVATTRLAPMGKIEIDAKIYEAKSSGVYIDAQSEVEVVGVERSIVVVKKVIF